MMWYPHFHHFRTGLVFPIAPKGYEMKTRTIFSTVDRDHRNADAFRELGYVDEFTWDWDNGYSDPQLIDLVDNHLDNITQHLAECQLHEYTDAPLEKIAKLFQKMLLRDNEGEDAQRKFSMPLPPSHFSLNSFRHFLTAGGSVLTHLEILHGDDDVLKAVDLAAVLEMIHENASKVRCLVLCLTKNVNVDRLARTWLANRGSLYGPF